MLKTALIILMIGALTALLSYAAEIAGILTVKSFFKIGFMGLGLMTIAAAYFLVAMLVEWAKETDFFQEDLIRAVVRC